MPLTKGSTFLKNIPFFSSCPPQDTEALKALCHEKRLRKNQFIFMEKDQAKALFILKEGKAKIIKDSIIGKTVIIRVVYPGGLMGEVAIFCNEPYPVSAQALENVVVYEISRKDLLPFLQRHPGFSEVIINVLVRRLKDAYAAIEGFAIENLEQRLIAVLLKMSETLGQREGDHWKLNVHVSRQDLADMIGCTKENICRVMARLKREGILKTSKKIILILDLDRLRKMREEEEE